MVPAFDTSLISRAGRLPVHVFQKQGRMKIAVHSTFRIWFTICMAAMFCCMQFSFRKAVHSTTEIIAGYTATFEKAATDLETIALSYKYGQSSLDSVQAALLRTRLAYKQTEFLLAYYYPEYVKDHINGAPLLHIERNDSRAAVTTPQGLQVLDELVFSDEAEKEKIQIASLAQQLKRHSNTLLAGFAQRKIKQEDWADAIRLQLVRLFTLGVTGFDTPGSLHALPEAVSSLTAMRKVTGSILQERGQATANVPLIAQLDSAIAYLQQPVSFDDFDRLTFLRNHIEPLYNRYARLFNTQSSGGNIAWNNNSTHIFSDDFLDPYYFTALTAKEDSRALRTLGEKLFYDPILSHNNQISCGTCHQPGLAFTDGRAKSASNVQGRTVQRNSPTLINAVYADRYFYDLRAFSLEQQAEHVIFHQMEFNTAYGDIMGKLNKSTTYPTLFRQCFGDRTVNRERFTKALASYVLSLRSFNSPFDQYVRRETDTLSQEAQQGFNLFMGKAACGTCHFAPTFAGLVPPLYTENESEILGLPEQPGMKLPDTDNGRYDNAVYSEKAWIYEKSFKTSTVRNIALTAPYFHHGAFQTLEQVIDFYDTGGGAGMGLTVKNQTLAADSLHLTAVEKRSLIAFMQTLTDTTIIRK